MDRDTSELISNVDDKGACRRATCVTAIIVFLRVRLK